MLNIFGKPLNLLFQHRRQIQRRSISPAARAGWTSVQIRVPSSTSLSPALARGFEAKSRKTADQENHGNSRAPQTTLEFCEQFTAPPSIVEIMVDTTGRRLWPTSSMLLDRLLAELFEGKSQTTINSKRDNNLTVLELGAGCGLVGTGLAAVSSSIVSKVHVVMTDQSTEWLEKNLKRNICLIPENASIEISPLYWGDLQDFNNLNEKMKPMSLSVGKNGRAKPIENQRELFDWIVGSDLLYNPVDHIPLIETLYAFAGPTTQIFIAYPRRQEDEQLFFSCIEQHEGDWKILGVEPLNPISKNLNEIFSSTCSYSRQNDSYSHQQTGFAMMRLSVSKPWKEHSNKIGNSISESVLKK